VVSRNKTAVNSPEIALALAGSNPLVPTRSGTARHHPARRGVVSAIQAERRMAFCICSRKLQMFDAAGASCSGIGADEQVKEWSDSRGTSGI